MGDVAVQLNLESLRNGTLRAAAPDVILPEYDPEQVVPRVLHIGPSNFFFAHMAKFSHDLLNLAAQENKPLDWGIVAVSLRSDAATRALHEQQGLYTLASVGVKPSTHEVIGSVKNVMFAKGEAIRDAIDVAADPNIKIITMTVTQNGYSSDAPQVWSGEKLTGEAEQLSTVELVVHALNLRKTRGLDPLVVASLDNMAENGTKLRSAVLARANHLAKLGLVDPSLAKWIEDEVPFLSSMVDRITPNTRKSNAQDMEGMGIQTAWAIRAEHMPSMPLVIEEMREGRKGQVFERSGIRDLAKVGGIIAEDVTPHERLKVGLLNGAHMAMGCIGHMCMGENGVSKLKDTHAAMQNPDIRKFIIGFMGEVRQVLPNVPGVDVGEFIDDVISRLDNPNMGDPLTRLARRGLEKVEGRIIDPMALHAKGGSIPKHLTFAFAAWLHYVSQIDNEGYLPTQIMQKAFKPETDKARHTAGMAPLSADDQQANRGEPNDVAAAQKGIPEFVLRNSATIAAVFSNTHIIKGPVASNSEVIREVKLFFDLIRDCGMETAVQRAFGPASVAPAMGVSRVSGAPHAPNFL